jgi:hypothetical protein
VSERWMASNYVRALIWLGLVVPLGVVLFDVAAGRWTETTSLLLFLGVVNAAAWAAGRQGEERTSTSHLTRHHG